MNDSAIVSIRYWDTEWTIREYSPQFTILDMVCYVGGLISLYTGFTFIAIYDYFTFIYSLIRKYTFAL